MASKDAPTWLVAVCSSALALAVLGIAAAVACGIVHGIEWILGG